MFDWNVAEEIQIQANAVVEWEMNCLENETFPREDYRELLELTVLFLGGSVFPFSFRKPGLIISEILRYFIFIRCSFLSRCESSRKIHGTFHLLLKDATSIGKI